MDVEKVAQTAKKCSQTLATAPTERKNTALRAMAEKLEERRDEIVSANEADMDEARADGLPDKLVNRLGFGDAKIDSRIGSLNIIEDLLDPVGQEFWTEKRPNGLRAARVRVPLGVIMMVYEARPHVTVNAGAFCLKSGNAAILRGGSEASNCNAVLGELWQESLEEAGLPADAIQVVSGSHEDVDALLMQDDCIDMVIPRGGEGLIESVTEKSKIPVVKHFAGICHVFMDEGCDVQKGLEVALDGKCLMPEVCNATETLLVSEALKDELPRIVEEFRRNGVSVRGDETVQSEVPDVEEATEEDWETEHLDMIISIRVVDGVEEAIEHVNTYGSHHTDSIVTDSVERADQFTDGVDSGVVLVNASTMFCDGESLGMGAEIGISTDKIHARGPMGLQDLTTYKFVIKGEGHIMGGPWT